MLPDLPAPTHDLQPSTLATSGARAALPPAGAAALAALTLGPGLAGATTALLGAVFPALVAAPLAEALALLAALAMALPAALAGATAARRRTQAGDPEGAQATAAGAGLAGAACSASAALALTQLGLASGGTAALAAIGATAVVGGGAFLGAVPARRRAQAVPALYQALAATAATAGALVLAEGLTTHLALTYSLLDAPRQLLYLALPYPFSDLASAAVTLGMLAPVTWCLARAAARHTPRASRPALAAGALFVVASPALAALTAAIPAGLTAPAVAGNQLALALGALLGSLPHLAALAHGLGRRAAVPALAEGTSGGRSPRPGC